MGGGVDEAPRALARGGGARIMAASVGREAFMGDSGGESAGGREAPLKVVRYPAPVLRSKRMPPSEVDYPGGLGALARDMIETMYLSRGVGLAAPQVGVNVRLAVIDVSPGRGLPMVLVEPRIVERSGSATDEEGCLSVPGINGRVKRAARVVVEHEDLDGATCRIEAEGLLARVLQHEIDHLDGKLFIDRLGMAKRLSIRRHLSRLEAAARRREAGAAAAGEEPT